MSVYAKDLRSLSQNMPENKERMQKRFELGEGAVKEISDSILQLKKAMARGDFLNIENEANRIKNRAAQKDEEGIKNLAFNLEVAAKHRDLRSVIENYQELA